MIRTIELTCDACNGTGLCRDIDGKLESCMNCLGSGRNEIQVDYSLTALLIIAYSTGYEHGHHDTVEGHFWGNGRSEMHDSHAAEWLDDAISDGTFDRDVTP